MSGKVDSKVGTVASSIYALFVIGTYIVVLQCGMASCGPYIIWPVMPWAYLVAGDFGLSFPWILYPIFLLLNIGVAYVLGAGIEW